MSGTFLSFHSGSISASISSKQCVSAKQATSTLKVGTLVAYPHTMQRCADYASVCICIFIALCTQCQSYTGAIPRIYSAPLCTPMLHTIALCRLVTGSAR